MLLHGNTATSVHPFTYIMGVPTCKESDKFEKL